MSSFPSMASLFAVVEDAAWEKVGSIPRNLLQELPESFRSFENKKDKVKYQIEFQAKLSKDAQKQYADLLKENMKEFYENSGWGWNEKKKLRELADEEARFLVIKDCETQSYVRASFYFPSNSCLFYPLA